MNIQRPAIPTESGTSTCAEFHGNLMPAHVRAMTIAVVAPMTRKLPLQRAVSIGPIYDEKGAHPVELEELLPECSFWSLQTQEYEYQESGHGTNRYVQVCAGLIYSLTVRF